MDKREASAFLEELDEIRVRAGLPRLDEASRREFLKTMGRGVAAGAAMAAVPGAAGAEDIEQILSSVPEGRRGEVLQAAMNNWEHELIYVLAYLSIVIIALQRNHESPATTEAVQSYEAAKDSVLQIIKKWSSTIHGDKAKGLKVFKARLALARESLTGEIDGDLSNLSILLHKYHKKYMAYAENPRELLNDYLRKEVQSFHRYK